MTKLPRYDDLLTLTLQALEALGGSGTIEEVDDWVIGKLDLTENELNATYEKSGALIIPDRCSWARSYLKIAGLTDSGGRGVWVIAEDGRAMLAAGDKDVRRVVADAYNKRAKTYRAKKEQSLAEPEADGPTPEFEWTEELLATLRGMRPDAFERLSQRLLREAGFSKVEVTGKPGDGGIDGVGVLRMNIVSFQVYFQCKRYTGSVGAGDVRDFRGAMAGRADKGLIITTGTFTPDAKREATRDGAPAIDLVDGDDLCRLLKQHGIGVSVKVVEEIEIQKTIFSEI